MAFDLKGTRPHHEEGHYFRLRETIWVPLWRYVTNLIPSLTEEQVFMGEYNDGMTVSPEQAVAMADFLEAHLDSGELAEYATEFNQRMLHDFPPKTCTSCEGTGIGKPPMALPENGACAFCRGTGTKQGGRPEFCLESAGAFAAFCRSSGGFEIN